MTSFININYFKNHLFYNYKTIIIFFLGLSIFSNIFSNIPLFVNEQSYSINNTIHGIFQNGIIKENFFIIDSYNLDNISSHMYGFSISNKGIVTDNYYKNIGKYEKPDPQGTFVLIRKSKDIYIFMKTIIRVILHSVIHSYSSQSIWLTNKNYH